MYDNVERMTGVLAPKPRVVKYYIYSVMNNVYLLDLDGIDGVWGDDHTKSVAVFDTHIDAFAMINDMDIIDVLVVAKEQ